MLAFFVTRYTTTKGEKRGRGTGMGMVCSSLEGRWQGLLTDLWASLPMRREEASGWL